MNYYISLGYNHQEGIVGGDRDRSNYRRLTLRSNATYTLFDQSQAREWLNKMTLGANISYARIHSKSIDANSQWGSALGSALYLSPILTPTVSGDEAQAQIDKYGAEYMLYDDEGRMYTIPGSVYQEMNNPLAMLSLLAMTTGATSSSSTSLPTSPSDGVSATGFPTAPTSLSGVPTATPQSTTSLATTAQPSPARIRAATAAPFGSSRMSSLGIATSYP